jgi:hypothetical protein
MNIYQTTIKILGTAALAVSLGACAPSLTEQHFGDSVRQMVRAQAYDPSTLDAPSEEAIDSTDGPLLEGVLEAYRGDVARREPVGNDIVINVGGR